MINLQSMVDEDRPFEPTLKEYRNLVFDFIKENKEDFIDSVGKSRFWSFIASNRDNLFEYVETVNGETNRELFLDWIDCDYLENVSEHEIKINIYTSLGNIEDFIVQRKFDYIDANLVLEIAQAYFNETKINVTGWVRSNQQHTQKHPVSCCHFPQYYLIQKGTGVNPKDNWKCANCDKTHYSM